MKIKINEYSNSNLIRLIREWANLTQKEFAHLIRKDKRTIYDYEAGNYTFNMITLRKIMDKVGLEITIEKKQE